MQQAATAAARTAETWREQSSGDRALTVGPDRCQLSSWSSRRSPRLDAEGAARGDDLMPGYTALAHQVVQLQCQGGTRARCSTVQ
jgi:hypothetical protein